MSKLFWDSNPYIYLFDGTSPFHKAAFALRQRMIERHDELFTSAMTLGEVQTGPRRAGNLILAQQFRDAICQSSRIISFDEAAADIYARLRENPAIKPPDAIQLACASAAGVELFITNDKALHKLTVPGIHFICSVERAPI